MEGLADLIGEAEDGPSTDLALEDVARLAAERFGRKVVYTPAAVRKWIRSGLRGVRLGAYPSGKGYRVRPAEFERFVSEVRGENASRPPQESAVAAREDDNLNAYQLQFGRRAYAALSR